MMRDNRDSESSIEREWVESFPGLSRLPPEIKKQLIDQSQIRQFAEGELIFGPSKSPEHMLFLLQGTVRVQQLSEDGREIVLYRIQAGQSCVMTTACLLAFDTYSAEGISETPVQAAAITQQGFDQLVAESPAFRRFVFAAFSKRMTELFLVIETLAFERVDVRLAQKLLLLCNAQHCVSTTHQQLATELGTAREVISRQLQAFERRGWIQKSRGAIRLLERDALQALAG